MKDDMIPMLELTMKINEVSIDDALFFNNKRKMKYMNLFNFRAI